MTLYQKLQTAQSEEDVKDAYIAALKLKKVTKGLIDIQTEEIWFEAKHKPTDVYTMFTQLLYYVCHAYHEGKNMKSLFLPPLLCVIDNEKAALMSTASITPVFGDKKIAWGKSASQVSRELIAQVSPYINDHFIVYRMAEDEAAFLQAVRDSIKNGGIVRTQITPNNLKPVFDRWVELIGAELGDLPNPADYALLFYADIMHDGNKPVIDNGLDTCLIPNYNGKPAFSLRGRILELASEKGYREFWNIYHRPPAAEHRNYLLERRDQLIPLDERQFKGAYYTPLKVVEKAYELLSETLGRNWQKNYIVWDMCCGVGNLETKHGNLRNVFMSTLDTADINVMQTGGQFPGATRFQYDYLNDDIAEDGTIDYTLTGKMPPELRAHIQAACTDKKKKILVLINPPYAEATSADTVSGKGKNKAGVAKTKVGEHMMAGYGKASNELFTQFLARIQKELPNAVVAMFSTLKYINAPNFEEFRQQWQPEFKGGFVVHSKSFDGLKGNFPIGFLIWDLSEKQPAQQEYALPAYTHRLENAGCKIFAAEKKDRMLNVWIDRPRANNMLLTVPLKNALSVYTSNIRVSTWSDNAIGYLTVKGNDLQNAGTATHIMSSSYGNGNGIYVTPDNLEKAAVVFAVRRVIKPTWLNDRDQFLQPHFGLEGRKEGRKEGNYTEIPQEFTLDCLLYMLFSGSNLTAGTAKDALEWNGRKWQLTNHFIPYDEAQVGFNGRFQSHFMSDYLRDKTLSKEAQAVYDEGLKLWQAFYRADIERKIRDEYLLDKSGAGWYQIRNALKKAAPQTDFAPFETAYAALAAKLEPLVYEYGFLKE